MFKFQNPKSGMKVYFSQVTPGEYQLVKVDDYRITEVVQTYSWNYIVGLIQSPHWVRI